MVSRGLGLWLLAATQAWAHPVPFKDAVAVTSLNQSFQNDFSVAYAFKRRTAVAARVLHFDDGLGAMTFYAPQLNFLVRRWNGSGYQSNIYALSAVGPMTFNEHEHSAILTAVEADAETRWLFVSGKAEKMWTGLGYDFWHLGARVGAAPYAARFDQMATWVMIQYEHSRWLRGWDRVTPLVRLFYRNYLVETGVSLDGDWLVNLMVHI